MEPISLDVLLASVGKEVGVSPWRAVTQRMIDQFADATDDHQFIHCDPERAARETLFGGAIAHGFLTLSMLPLSAALPVVLAAWIVNQAIGFGVLGYPMEMNTLLWGLAIGVAALAATAVSARVPRLLPAGGRAATLTLAVIAAYAVYEIVLLAFAPALGGSGALTMTIIARLGLLNVLWMLGLVAACEIAALLIAATRRRLT